MQKFEIDTFMYFILYLIFQYWVLKNYILVLLKVMRT